MTTAGQANEQEVRELAEVIFDAHLTSHTREMAEYLLTSDWLARVRREAKAEALREAADAWQTGGWADNLPQGGGRPALILGMARSAVGWLRNRADAIEAGDPS